MILIYNMEKKIFDYCEKKYNEIFSIVQKKLIRATKRKISDLSEQKQNEIENKRTGGMECMFFHIARMLTESMV